MVWGSISSSVNRKHPFRRWNLNHTVQILLVLCYLPWHKWESNGWAEGHAVSPGRDSGLEQRDIMNALRLSAMTHLHRSECSHIEYKDTWVYFVYYIIWLKWDNSSSFFFVFSQSKSPCPPHKSYPPGINCLCCSVAQQSIHWESPEMQANTESLCLLSRELGRVQQPNPWSWNIRPAVM